MLAVLGAGIYPGLSSHVLEAFSATPLTVARLTSNSDGAITGWAVDVQPIGAADFHHDGKTGIPGSDQGPEAEWAIGW